MISSGWLKRFVGNTLGINLDDKRKITGAKYTEGKVDFDGKFYFTVTDVIPMYLRKMLQALRNSNEIMLTGSAQTKDELIVDIEKVEKIARAIARELNKLFPR
jgi:hypothetical protein